MIENIVNGAPEGWWYSYDLSDKWKGAFPTMDAALIDAKASAPTDAEFIKLTQVLPWQRNEIRIRDPEKHYKPCPNCDRGFDRWEGSLPAGRICRTCDGSGRIEVPDKPQGNTEGK